MGKRLVRVPSPGSHKRDKCSQTRFGGKRGRRAGNMLEEHNQTPGRAGTNTQTQNMLKEQQEGMVDGYKNPTLHQYGLFRLEFIQYLHPHVSLNI